MPNNPWGDTGPTPNRRSSGDEEFAKEGFNNPQYSPDPNINPFRTPRQNRLDLNQQVERGSIDDWKKRFKNEYMTQLRAGSAQAGGQMRADAGGRGFSPAMMQAADQQAGQVTADTRPMGKVFGRQLDMAEAMARYDQSQRSAQLNLADAELQGVISGQQAANFSYDQERGYEEGLRKYLQEMENEKAIMGAMAAYSAAIGAGNRM